MVEIFIAISIIVLSLLGICLILVRDKQYVKFVKKNSILLQKLSDLNQACNFYESDCNCNEEHIYDNENFYDNISCEDYLIYQLQFKKYDIESEIKKIKYNKQKYEKYCEDVLKICEFGNFQKDTKNFRKKYLIKTEKILFEKAQLHPEVEFSLKVSLYCAKINGVVYAHKSQIFVAKEIEDLIDRLNNKRGTFFQDRDIWASLCRVERGKVSNKMRFSIYQRDGYRCRYCGRTESSDYLEIDHIKPIAKGGKSVYDNLQTLCRRCNKNKGDTY